MLADGRHQRLGKYISRVDSTDGYVRVYFDVDGREIITVEVGRSIANMEVWEPERVRLTWRGTGSNEIAYAEEFAEVLRIACEVARRLEYMAAHGPVDAWYGHDFDGRNITQPLVHGESDYVLCLGMLMLGGKTFYRRGLMRTPEEIEKGLNNLDSLRMRATALVIEAADAKLRELAR